MAPDLSLDSDEWAGMDISVRRGNDHDPSWFAGLDDRITAPANARPKSSVCDR